MCILQLRDFSDRLHKPQRFYILMNKLAVVVEEMMMILASRTHGLFSPFQFKQASLYVWLTMQLATTHLVWHRSPRLSFESRDTCICAGNVFSSLIVHALPLNS